MRPAPTACSAADWAADAKKAGQPLADYVKQSIVDPNAYIVPSFQKDVMPGLRARAARAGAAVG